MIEQDTLTQETLGPAAAGMREMEFLPYSDAYLENPHPFLNYYRRDRPTFFSPYMNMWVVTRYDDVLAMLKDPQRFSSKNWFSTSARLAPETMALLKGTMFDSESGGLVSADPPIHTRLRRALTGALTPQLVAQLEDHIRTLANQVIDTFPDQDPIDFVESFARKLPVPVLCKLIGIPESDGDWIRQSCDNVEILFIQTMSEDEQKTKAHAYVDLFNYIGDILDDRRRSPQNDLATALQHSEVADIGRSESIELLITLLTAGIGTSTHFFSACLFDLIQQGAWATLQHDPKYLAQVVEETLRIVSPVHGIFRITTQEVELGGVTLPAGVLVYGMVASANRDEKYFNDPHALEIQREKSAHHLAFGHGIHYCAGAPVFRLEARVALDVLHQRLPRLRLAENHPPIRFLPGLLLRGMEHLYIERG